MKRTCFLSFAMVFLLSSCSSGQKQSAQNAPEISNREPANAIYFLNDLFKAKRLGGSKGFKHLESVLSQMSRGVAHPRGKAKHVILGEWPKFFTSVETIHSFRGVEVNFYVHLKQVSGKPDQKLLDNFVSEFTGNLDAKGLRSRFEYNQRPFPVHGVTGRGLREVRVSKNAHVKILLEEVTERQLSTTFQMFSRAGSRGPKAPWDNF